MKEDHFYLTPPQTGARSTNQDHTVAEDLDAFPHLLVGFAELFERDYLTETWVNCS
jgi:hypothetical protein